MFRRKGTFDDPQNLYDEDTPGISPSFKYSGNRKEGPPSIFDSQQPETFISAKEPPRQWSGNPGPSSFDTMNLSSFEESPETTLGEGVSFKGELEFERLLRIDGSFEGNLISSGKIIVGTSGKVKANIDMQEAIIEGHVQGNITVKDKIELRGGAVVEGDITAKNLCVDEGVSIIGFVRVTGSVEIEV